MGPRPPRMKLLRGTVSWPDSASRCLPTAGSSLKPPAGPHPTSTSGPDTCWPRGGPRRPLALQLLPSACPQLLWGSKTSASRGFLLSLKHPHPWPLGSVWNHGGSKVQGSVWARAARPGREKGRCLRAKGVAWAGTKQAGAHSPHEAFSRELRSTRAPRPRGWGPDGPVISLPRGHWPAEPRTQCCASGREGLGPGELTAARL